MPTVENPTLTLTTVNDATKVTVTFNAVFTAFERQLAGLGMTFHQHIDVIGIDPPGSFTGSVMIEFPMTGFAVTVGSGSQTIFRNAEMTTHRGTFQEDNQSGDADEIRCKIRIHSVGLPLVFSPDVFTDQKILLG